MLSWIAIAAGVSVIIPQLAVALIIHYNSTYAAHAWHVFLIYQAVSVLCLLYNIFLLRRTMWIFNFSRKFNRRTIRWSMGFS